VWRAPQLRVVLVWAAVRLAQVLYARFGWGHDPYAFLGHVHRWAEGAIPYRDFTLEYPPGALLAFVPPYLLSGNVRRGYILWFELEMMAFDLLCVLLVAAWARRLWSNEPQRQWLAIGSYLLMTASLHQVLYSRFDIVPAALAVGALFWIAARGAPGFGGLLLGLAVATKLWPIVLAPIALVAAYRAQHVRGAARVVVGASVGVALPWVPLLVVAGPAAVTWIVYHTERSLQIESVWAGMVFVLDRVGWIVSQNSHDHGSWHLVGAVPEWLASWTTPISGMLILLPWIVAWHTARDDRSQRRSPGPDDRRVLSAAAATVVGILVGAKILSPQFLIWPAPLLALAVPAHAGALIATAAAFLLTALVYPFGYDQLGARGEHFDTALAILVARNGALVYLYVRLVAAVRGPARKGTIHGT